MPAIEDVPIENISSEAVQPLYRRVMECDIEPTAFDEFVTGGEEPWTCPS